MIERNRFTMASAIGHCVGKRKEDDQKKNKGERKTKRKRKSSVDLHSHFFRVAIFLFLPHTGTHQMIIDTIYFGLLIRFRSKSNGDARNGRCGKRDRNSIEKKKQQDAGPREKVKAKRRRRSRARRTPGQWRKTKQKKDDPFSVCNRKVDEIETDRIRSFFHHHHHHHLLSSSSLFFFFTLGFGVILLFTDGVTQLTRPVMMATDSFFLCVCLSVFLLFLCFHFVALIFLFPLPWHSPFTFFTEFFYRVFFCCCC